MSYIAIGLAVIALGAAATCIVLALRNGGLTAQVAQLTTERDRALLDRATAITAAQDAEKQKAQNAAASAKQIADLTADLEGLRRDLDQCSDPDVLRDRFDRIMQQARGAASAAPPPRSDGTS